jgi:hypothetical protein
MCAFIVDYCVEVDGDVMLPFGGGFCFVLVQRYPFCLRLIPARCSIAPDACEDNIIERHYRLCMAILIAIQSVLARASQIVFLVSAAVHQPVLAIASLFKILSGTVKAPLRFATTIGKQYRNADNVHGVPSIDTAR